MSKYKLTASVVSDFDSSKVVGHQVVKDNSEILYVKKNSPILNLCSNVGYLNYNNEPILIDDYNLPKLVKFCDGYTSIGLESIFVLGVYKKFDAVCGCKVIDSHGKIFDMSLDEFNRRFSLGENFVNIVTASDFYNFPEVLDNRDFCSSNFGCKPINIQNDTIQYIVKIVDVISSDIFKSSDFLADDTFIVDENQLRNLDWRSF